MISDWQAEGDKRSHYEGSDAEEIPGVLSDSSCLMNMEEPRPVTATLDINLLYDKALGRQGEAEFDQIVDLAQQGKVKLFFTVISDVEDRSGAVMEVAIRLLMDGILSEDPHAGTPRDFMPYGSGGYSEDDPPHHVLLHALWPRASFMSKSMTNKENDVLSLQSHMRNGRDVYLTRDKEIWLYADWSG